jgi:LysR family transcriptional regulator for bpeEF and oprC
MDKITLYRIFTRVVESASFTSAAHYMAIPRSTVSTAVGELETKLGVRLLHRTTRSMRLTPDGELFYLRALQILADIEETEALFRQTTTLPEGRVRVNVPSRMGRLLVAPELPDFLDRYPGIEVVLGSTDRAVSLVEEGVDCVLRVGHLTDSSLIARSIGQLTLINVASPKYLARHGLPQHPDDLERHWVVKYASPSSGRVEAWEWEEGGKCHAREFPGRVTVNSAESYIACCKAGLGLIQIPAYDVQHDLASGELIEVMSAYRAPPLPMNLLWPHREYRPLAVQHVVDWLSTLIRQAVGTIR